jgi:lipoyl(octanoyl) transferase
MQAPPLVRYLGQVEYEPTWRRMQAITEQRAADQPDELWFLEHPPVFTLGLNGRREHLLAPGGIPVVQVDRGGQVTYHGPGQLVVYLLLDLGRAGLGARALVCALERAVIRCVAGYGIVAAGNREAPGVYVDGRKLASIGLRIRRNCSYHGLALNVDMDLTPFQGIDPCGFKGLELTQLSDLGVAHELPRVAADLESMLLDELAQAPPSLERSA